MEKEKHIAETILEYCAFLGVKKIDDLPGLWSHQVNETWTIKCNGHEYTIDNVPPLCFYVSYNGFPAGIFSVMGDGIIAAGEGANKNTLRAVLEQQMALAT